MRAAVPYRFNVINCEKPNSQFNYGMRSWANALNLLDLPEGLEARLSGLHQEWHPSLIDWLTTGSPFWVPKEFDVGQNVSCHYVWQDGVQPVADCHQGRQAGSPHSVMECEHHACHSTAS